MRKLRRQKPYKGGRDSLVTCLLPSMAAEAREQARKYGVYPSFVIATWIAQVVGDKEQEDYTRYESGRDKQKKAS